MILEKKSFNMNTKIKELRILLFLLFISIVIQCIFYKYIRETRPYIAIVPTPPSINTLKAMSFGDDGFYFRLQAYKIQNMGDTFGRNTPLDKYDYSKLYYWLKFIDLFDTKSNYLTSLAAYYFSSTQEPKDTIHLIKFLEEHADYDLKTNWWWLYQATYIAKYIYRDNEMAIKLARKMKDTSPKDAPLWSKRMEGIFLAQNDQSCEALRVMSEILNEYDTQENITEQKIKELNYMRYFIEKNTKKLMQEGIDFNKCLNKEKKL